MFDALRSHATDSLSQVHGSGGQRTIKATCNDGYCSWFYKPHSQTQRQLIGSTCSDQVEIHLNAKDPVYTCQESRTHWNAHHQHSTVVEGPWRRMVL